MSMPRRSLESRIAEFSAISAEIEQKASELSLLRKKRHRMGYRLLCAMENRQRAPLTPEQKEKHREADRAYRRRKRFNALLVRDAA